METIEHFIQQPANQTHKTPLLFQHEHGMGMALAAQFNFEGSIMSKIQETNTEIVITEKMPNGVRVFLFIIGLIPTFLAPYEMLIQPRWPGFSLYLIIPILISIGAVLAGGLFITAGLFGLDSTFQFSIESRSIQYSYKSALIPLRKRTYKFSDIVSIEIKTHNWSDGPSTYGLQFTFRDGQKIETGSFEKKDIAEQYLGKIKTLIR